MIKNRSYAKLVFANRYTTAHRDWVERGYVGEGQIVEENENLSGIKYLGGVELSRIKFTNCNLANSDIDSSRFNEAEMINCDWTNSDLDGNDYNRATIKNCDFVKTNFRWCKFVKAQIEGGNWSNCDFIKPYFTGAKIDNVNFESSILVESLLHKSKIRNCSFKNAYLNYSSASFAVWENCDFRGVDFDNVRLRKVIFKNCGFYDSYGNPDALDSVQIIEPDLSPNFDGSQIVQQQTIIETWHRNAEKRLQSRQNGLIPEKSVALIVFSRRRTEAHGDWVKRGFVREGRIVEENNNLSGFNGQILYDPIRSRLVGCQLNNSNILDASFDEAEIIDCNWNNSYFSNSSFVRAQIQNCDFAEVNLASMDLDEAKVEGGNWNKSKCDRTWWRKAQVKDVDFQQSTFIEAKLDNGAFFGCNFRAVNLSSAIATATLFENCNFRGVNFEGVKLDSTTFKNCNFHDSYGNPGQFSSVTMIDPDLSPDFDGSEIVDTEQITKLWLNNSELVQSEIVEIANKVDNNSEELAINSTPEALEQVQDLPKLQEESEPLTDSEESKTREQLQQDLESDKKQLEELRSQLKKVDVRIENARRTNIFGRPQSGVNERERDSLMAEINESEARIAQNKSAIEALEHSSKN